MKIALLAPPWIPTPPQGYGGTESVVSNLADGLVKKGHEVTLFATGDSNTSACLEYYYSKAIGNNFFAKQNPYIPLFHIHAFYNKMRKEKYDVLHNHMAYSAFFFLDLQDTPFVHTLHGAYYKELIRESRQISDKREVLSRFKYHNFVSISDQQRNDMPELNYVKTVYNSIRGDMFSLGTGKGNYLYWIGRITPCKGLDTAIRAAQKTGMKLIISGFIDPGNQDYFDSKIKPQLKNNIEFIGEVNHPDEKNKLLGNALATLFPIQWHEPFGLVMVESMAAGTPVIAFNKGSASEIIEDSKTGFVVDSEEQMIDSIGKISSIDRAYCYKYAHTQFSVKKMVEGYEEVYKTIAAR